MKIRSVTINSTSSLSTFTEYLPDMICLAMTKLVCFMSDTSWIIHCRNPCTRHGHTAAGKPLKPQHRNTVLVRPLDVLHTGRLANVAQ